MGCVGSKQAGTANKKAADRKKPPQDAVPAVAVQEGRGENQIGGHAYAFVWSDDKITKKTQQIEIDTYLKINSERSEEDSPELQSLQKLKPFVPAFYGGKVEDGVVTIQIENLLQGTKDPAFMDIKLGTDTITMNTRKEGEAAI